MVKALQKDFQFLINVMFVNHIYYQLIIHDFDLHLKSHENGERYSLLFFVSFNSKGPNFRFSQKVIFYGSDEFKKPCPTHIMRQQY